MNTDKIKSDHPSLCHGCIWGRRMAHIDNVIEGWVGCAFYVKQNNDDSHLQESAGIGEGWVDLRTEPLSEKSSGIITNMVLVTRGTTKCTAYGTE